MNNSLLFFSQNVPVNNTVTYTVRFTKLIDNTGAVNKVRPLRIKIASTDGSVTYFDSSFTDVNSSVVCTFESSKLEAGYKLQPIFISDNEYIRINAKTIEYGDNITIVNNVVDYTFDTEIAINCVETDWTYVAQNTTVAFRIRTLSTSNVASDTINNISNVVTAEDVVRASKSFSGTNILGYVYSVIMYYHLTTSQNYLGDVLAVSTLKNGTRYFIITKTAAGLELVWENGYTTNPLT